MNKLNKSLLSMAIVSVLGVGCSSNDDGPKVTPGSLSGSVAKGIVKNGIVKAHLMNADGSAGDEVASTNTGPDGSYSLTMPDSYDGSPLLLKLSAGDSTTMVCDVSAGCGSTAFGGDIALTGTGFTLSAAVPSVEDDTTVNASITAFTDMAASKVMADGGVSASSILAANSQVSQLVGVNILSASPVNIADRDDDTATFAKATPAEQRYSIMLAAFASEAFKDTGTDGVDVSDLIANIDSFNTDFADGDIGDADGLSPTALYAAASAVIQASASSLDADTITQANQFVTIMQAQIDDDIIAPEPTTGENPSQVAQAKAFLSEVRTWANSLQTLENPAEELLNDAGTISETLNADSGAVLEVLSMALGVAAEAISDANDDGTAVPGSVTVNDDDGESIGTVTITDGSVDGSSKEYVLSSTGLSGVVMDATVKLNVDPQPNTTVSAGDVTLSVDGTASNSNIALALSNVEFTINLTESLELGADDDISSKFGGAGLKGMLSAAVLDEGTATGEKIVGDAEIKFVSLAPSVGGSISNDINMTLEKIALNDLTVTNDDSETAGLSISFEVNDAASFDTLSYLDSEPVIYTKIPKIDLDLQAMESPLNLASVDEYRYEKYGTYNNSTGIWSPMSCAYEFGDFGSRIGGCLDGDTIGIHDQVKTAFYSQAYVTSVEVDNYHVVVDTSDSYGRARLELTDMETAESFLDATLNITGKIDLDGREEAMLTITANKTGIDAGNMTATLGYAGKSLQLSASTSNGDEDGTDASLSFSNAAGVAMTMTASDDFTNGNVTVDGEEVGVIESEDGVILMRYNDGTFESL